MRYITLYVLALLSVGCSTISNTTKHTVSHQCTKPPVAVIEVHNG